MENKDFMHILFQGVDDLEMKTGHDESWLQMDRKLSEKAFLKFSWTRFNIFYASLIFLTFLFSSVTSIHYLFHIHEKDSVVAKIQEQEKQGTMIEKGKETVVLPSESIPANVQGSIDHPFNPSFS